MRILFLLASLLFITMSDGTPQKPLRTNKDHALFFAISDYTNGLTDLSQPIKNATDIAGVLEQRYGFKTEIVKNPSFAQIRNKLNDYRQKYVNGTLPSDGQLLIFFSGHGVKEYETGYFLPADADPDAILSTSLSYVSWRGFINNINCKHILVAVDACYSVTFDPNWESKGDEDGRWARKGELSETERILANHKDYSSRLFFTSDSQEDITPGRSNFARKMLEGLANHRGNEPFISAEELFASYIKKAQPTPNAGDFGKDDPRSNFLFFYKATFNIGDTRADLAAYQQAINENTITAYQIYLRNYPTGDFRGVIEDKLAILEAEEAEFIAWEEAKALNTNTAYADFIKNYPTSGFRAVAERNIKKPVVTPPSSGNKAFVHDGMVFVKGDSFQMGSNKNDSEKPIHRVTISDFYIGKYEVTQKQWRDVMGSDPSYNKDCDNCPVEQVSWDNIQDFLSRLNQQTNRKYRLPTEAEWEYAARGGTESKGYKYAGTNKGRELSKYANFCDVNCEHSWKDESQNDGYKYTAPVGSFLPNELGIYDMSGNVWEWCEDDWHDNYSDAPKEDSAWIDSFRGSMRVRRGGAWSRNAGFCQVAIRAGTYPEVKSGYIGFRLAHSL